jgi:acetyl/propionyl-CoA carboxylase alpha subunit
MFVPRPGPIDTLVWPPASSDLRVEAGVEAGSKVTPHYDSMIAKIIAHAGTRDEAIAKLHAALGATTIGPVVHNVEFLREVLMSDVFKSGVYDTLFAEAFAKAPKPA